MWLKTLLIVNCRNIVTAELTLSPTINYIVGDNGSGKTSLLEALSILSMGRSFRTPNIKQIINRNTKHITVSGSIVTESINDYHVGIRKEAGSTTIKINKQYITSQAELSKHLPLTVIHPLSYELITGGATIRRKYIDWIAFYQDDNFHLTWLKYQKILKQRNATLRNTKSHYALEYLTAELCKLQPVIHQARVKAVSLLQKKIQEITPNRLSAYIPKITLNSGFPGEIASDTDSLITYYQSQQANELRLKRTIKGAHTANIIFTIDGEPVSATASRGETKTIAIMLLVAQSLTITKYGIIAFDDLHAELDKEHYEDILAFIESINRQIIITTISEPRIRSDHKLFHVKQGLVKLTKK